MKLRQLIPGLEHPGKTIAHFGQAQLVQKAKRSWELRGGQPQDHAEAREWISLFFHEAVLPKAYAPCARPLRIARPRTFRR